MLFVSYWELNENMPDKDRLEAIHQIMAMEGSDKMVEKSIRWDITPDNWGVSIFEADSAADVMALFDTYRAAAPGFFKMTKTAPAVTAQESMAMGEEINKALGN